MKIITTKKYNQFIDRINQLELELLENKMNLTTSNATIEAHSNATIEAQRDTISKLEGELKEARDLKSVLEELTKIVSPRCLPRRRKKMRGELIVSTPTTGDTFVLTPRIA